MRAVIMHAIQLTVYNLMSDLYELNIRCLAYKVSQVEAELLELRLR